MNRLACEEEALSHIRPKADEHDRIWAVAGELLEAVNESGKAKGMVVGSIARDTWVSGDRDLDIFMLFDPSLSREQLEESGLGLARDLATRFGDAMQEKYAEHPYINATIHGLDVDLVPCFEVERATEIQSAVDRTPFHTRYIRERIRDHVDDVLLLKQFSKAGGIYGSDQMTEGFAGYLCELFILHYGSFNALLEGALAWRPGTVIDIEGHQAKKFKDPLVVIDPVDPERNVAASLSLTRMFEFVELAGGYLEKPSIDFFYPPQPSRMGPEDFVKTLDDRGTGLYAITFPTPDLIPDVVVPQLRKSLDAIEGLLSRNGFLVNRGDTCMGEKNCMILLEFLVDVLPSVKKHMGPPAWNQINAAKFTSKYVENTFSGPYIEDGRYFVEVERKYTSAEDLLNSPELLQCGLGKHVLIAISDDRKLWKGKECWQDDFITFISGFMERRSPLLRIRHETEEKKMG